MENVLDLKLSGLLELGKEELREFNGGNPALPVLGAIAAASAITIGWKSLCDAVHEAGKNIGAALAQ
ncbi:MAG TPA: hypothetical protein DER09_08780 [Prolixibacteraceae bacterium]|nr:hypothetical protein [Prolixibacteraceae bacterium]